MVVYICNNITLHPDKINSLIKSIDAFCFVSKLLFKVHLEVKDRLLNIVYKEYLCYMNEIEINKV